MDVLDRGADTLVPLAGVRTSVVEAARAPSATETPRDRPTRSVSDWRTAVAYDRGVRDPGRLVEVQVLARAGARALAAGAVLGVQLHPIAGAVLGLAAGATAIVERAAVVRALDARRPLRRAALEASAATGLLVVLALLQLLVLGRGAVGPEGQVEGFSAVLAVLASMGGKQVAALTLGLAAVAVSTGALSGALAIDRMDQRTSEFGGVWSLWLLGASLLLGLLAGTAALVDLAALELRRLAATFGVAFVTTLFAGVVLHLTMGVVFVLDRGADALVRLAGVRPSVVEAARASSPAEPPA